MKVILKQDVKGLGQKGQVIDVREGYARNYLIPRGLVAEASKSNLKAIEQEKSLKEQKEARQREEAQRLAAQLEKNGVTIRTKVGDSGRLFGSVTSTDIAEAIKAVIGSEIDKRKVDLAEPIKSVGTYVVPVKLYHDIQANLKVDVVPLEEK